MNQIEKNKAKNVEVLKEAVKVAHDMNNTAINTNQNLYENGQKLENINDKLNKINGTLYQSKDTAKEITSYWYYLKNKVKKALGLKKQFKVQEKEASKTNQNPIRASQKQKEGELELEDNQNVDEEQELGNQLLMKLREMKHNCKQMGHQLDRQKPKIEKIQAKMDKASDEMLTIKKILKKAL